MQTDELNAVFSALAHPTRRAIVHRLAHGEATVSELAAPFELSMPGISKHLRVLKAAGLVVQGRDAQRRPCRLDAAPLKEVAAWAETFRANWEVSYARLDDYMREVQRRRDEEARDAH